MVNVDHPGEILANMRDPVPILEYVLIQEGLILNLQYLEDCHMQL